MIKVVEGEREDFEREVNKLSKKGFLAIPATHRIFEYCGKITYSVVTSDETEDEDEN